MTSSSKYFCACRTCLDAGMALDADSGAGYPARPSGMDPIGQTVAQIPHFVHFSGSVFGFAFRTLQVFHPFQAVYNRQSPDHRRGPRSLPGISVISATFFATFSPNSAIFARSSASGRPVASLLLNTCSVGIPAAAIVWKP